MSWASWGDSLCVFGRWLLHSFRLSWWSGSPAPSFRPLPRRPRRDARTSLAAVTPNGGSSSAPVQRSGTAPVGAATGSSAQPGAPANPNPNAAPKVTTSVKSVTRAATANQGARSTVNGRVEIVSERTSTSRTYLNPDGTQTSELAQTPQFAPVGPGNLVPLDENFIPAASASGAVTPDEAAVPVSFSTKASSAGSVASVNTSDGWVGFGLQRVGVGDWRGVGGADPVQQRMAVGGPHTRGDINRREGRDHAEVDVSGEPATSSR